jgi:hypothetical protein
MEINGGKKKDVRKMSWLSIYIARQDFVMVHYLAYEVKFGESPCSKKKVANIFHLPTMIKYLSWYSLVKRFGRNGEPRGNQPHS